MTFRRQVIEAFAEAGANVAIWYHGKCHEADNGIG